LIDAAEVVLEEKKHAVVAVSALCKALARAEIRTLYVSKRWAIDTGSNG